MEFNIKYNVVMTEDELVDELDRRILKMPKKQVIPLLDSNIDPIKIAFHYRAQFVEVKVPRDYFIAIWFLL